MGSQYIVLSELLSDQAAFITSPKTSLANYWGALPPCPLPVSTGLHNLPLKCLARDYILVIVGEKERCRNNRRL